MLIITWLNFENIVLSEINKSDTKAEILYYFVYKKYLERVNLQGHETNGWLPDIRGGRNED